MTTIEPPSATPPITIEPTEVNNKSTGKEPITVQSGAQPINLNVTVNTTPPPKPPDIFSTFAYLSAEIFLQAALAYNQPAAYFTGAVGGLIGKYWVNKDTKSWDTILNESAEALPGHLNQGVADFAKAHWAVKLIQLATKTGITYAATRVYSNTLGPLYAAYQGQAHFGNLTFSEFKELASPVKNLITSRR